MHKLVGQRQVARDTTSEMRRVLNFAGVTIDQVVNCPMARRKAMGYFRLMNQIRRVSETVDLERQWNPQAISFEPLLKPPLF